MSLASKTQGTTTSRRDSVSLPREQGWRQGVTQARALLCQLQHWKLSDTVSDENCLSLKPSSFPVKIITISYHNKLLSSEVSEPAFPAPAMPPTS